MWRGSAPRTTSRIPKRRLAHLPRAGARFLWDPAAVPPTLTSPLDAAFPSVWVACTRLLHTLWLNTAASCALHGGQVKPPAGGDFRPRRQRAAVHRQIRVSGGGGYGSLPPHGVLADTLRGVSSVHLTFMTTSSACLPRASQPSVLRTHGSPPASPKVANARETRAQNARYRLLKARSHALQLGKLLIRPLVAPECLYVAGSQACARPGHEGSSDYVRGAMPGSRSPSIAMSLPAFPHDRGRPHGRPLMHARVKGARRAGIRPHPYHPATAPSTTRRSASSGGA